MQSIITHYLQQHNSELGINHYTFKSLANSTLRVVTIPFYITIILPHIPCHFVSLLDPFHIKTTLDSLWHISCISFSMIINLTAVLLNKLQLMVCPIIIRVNLQYEIKNVLERYPLGSQMKRRVPLIKLKCPFLDPDCTFNICSK